MTLWNFKQPRWNSEEYADWIRGLPCAASGEFPVEAAHVSAKGIGGGAKTMFCNLVPLAPELHHLQHQKGWGALEKESGFGKDDARKAAAGLTERYLVEVIEPRLKELKELPPVGIAPLQFPPDPF